MHSEKATLLQYPGEYRDNYRSVVLESWAQAQSHDERFPMCLKLLSITNYGQSRYLSYSLAAYIIVAFRYGSLGTSFGQEKKASFLKSICHVHLIWQEMRSRLVI